MTEYTPTPEEVRGWITEHKFAAFGERFDRMLANVKAEAFREGHREGHKTAREDLVSGALIGGPTYEALRDSFTGQQIWKEAQRAAEIEKGESDV